MRKAKKELAILQRQVDTLRGLVEVEVAGAIAVRKKDGDDSGYVLGRIASYRLVLDAMADRWGHREPVITAEQFRDP